MEWLWLNATANLIRDGPDVGVLLFSLYVYLRSIPVQVYIWGTKHDLTSAQRPQRQHNPPPRRSLPLLCTLQPPHHKYSRTSDLANVPSRPHERSYNQSNVSVAPPLPLPVLMKTTNQPIAKPNLLPRNTSNPSPIPNQRPSSARTSTTASLPCRNALSARVLAMVWRRGKEVGNFRKIYGLGEEAADRITFLHP